MNFGGKRDVYLDISASEKNFGQTFKFDIAENLDSFDLNSKQFDFINGVSFKGYYIPSSRHIDIFGTFFADVRSNCDKCLNDAYFKLSFDYKEKFIRDYIENADSQEEIYSFSGHRIDLEKSIMDNIVLNLPLYCYCKPDCKGLCKYCGKDLNKETCSCENENLKASSPFGVLGDLFDNNKEV